MQIISIVIPAFNEEKFIGFLLEKIAALPLEKIGYGKEIVVIDDGSTDRTKEIVSKFPSVHYIYQKNQGKGAAVQRGLDECKGDYVLVQDADLEYDPTDYIPMLEKLSNNSFDVIYGSRTLGQIQERGWISLFPGKHPQQGMGPWLANLILSLWTLILFGKWFSDLLTAYKLYPIELIRRLNVKTRGFETDHEMTAKILRRSVRIVEVPIRYFPRSVEEGKKIKARDGFIAVWTLLRFRFTD